jgi:hypothetical protein
VRFRWKAAADSGSQPRFFNGEAKRESQRFREIIMKNDKEILQQLAQATADLSFMSESDYPFEIVCWGEMKEITSDYLRKQAGAEAAAPVKIVSPKKFFAVAISEPDWKGEDELATARRYQALVRLLKENLHDLKVYRVGEINIAVYIVGRAATGNYIGLSTRVVET